MGCGCGKLLPAKRAQGKYGAEEKQGGDKAQSVEEKQAGLGQSAASATTDKGAPASQKNEDKGSLSGQRADDKGPSNGQTPDGKGLSNGQTLDGKGPPNGQRVDEKATSDGSRVTPEIPSTLAALERELNDLNINPVSQKGAEKSLPSGPSGQKITDTTPQPLYCEGSAHPPGPLVDGEYIWRLATPAKVFKAKHGLIDWSNADLFHDVQEFRFSHFLGSGAAGVVYKASYRNAAGETSQCAVKFAGALPHLKPDSHEALGLLVQRDTTKPSPVYEAEKQTFGLLRAVTESHWKKYTCGRVRMLQLVGFLDAAQVILLEFVDGSQPKYNLALMKSVNDLLKQVAQDRQVEVGDVKYEHLVQDSKGVTTIIDFGSCRYTGESAPKVCSKDITVEMRNEVGPSKPNKDTDGDVAHLVDGKLVWKTKDGKRPKVSDDFADLSYEHDLMGVVEDRCVSLAEVDQGLRYQ